MKWTEKEETILKNNFFDKTGPELALMLDRTLFSIKAKIKSLGLTKREKDYFRTTTAKINFKNETICLRNL